MNRPLRDVSRFSARAARRWRLICFAIVFIVIALLALGSALVLAFDESAPPPSYGFEIPQSSATPAFSNPFARAGDKASGGGGWFASCHSWSSWPALQARPLEAIANMVTPKVAA